MNNPLYVPLEEALKRTDIQAMLNFLDRHYSVILYQARYSSTDDLLKPWYSIIAALRSRARERWILYIGNYFARQIGFNRFVCLQMACGDHLPEDHAAMLVLCDETVDLYHSETTTGMYFQANIEIWRNEALRRMREFPDPSSLRPDPDPAPGPSPGGADPATTREEPGNNYVK